MKRIKYLTFIALILLCINCEGRSTMIREPVVAGSFYPADPSKLRRIVDDYLQKASVDIEGKVLGIISPHAGYPYSGKTAGYAFKSLKKRQIDLVILLGPSHHAYIDGFSVYDSGKWKTPLGEVEIDSEFAERLKSHSDLIHHEPDAHRKEHSLEVQIPFLQRALEDFKIVPVAMNESDIRTCSILAEALSEELKNRDNWVIISSSDLYHGYDYELAKEVTTEVDELIQNLNAEEVLKYNSEMQSRGACAACGASGIAITIMTLKELGAKEAVLLNRTNSLDETGKKSGYAVGYGAWAILNSNGENEESSNSKNSSEKISDEDSTDDMILSGEEKSILLEIARTTIEKYIRQKEVPEFDIKNEKLKRKSGAFVTLKKNGKLRGCIGLIREEKPLHQAIKEMAISASTRDPRFPAVSPEEIDRITIEISVLTPLQKVSDPESIKVGRDGLLIQKGMRSGLLLPQVPVEQGWNRETFLEQTCYKAGLPSDAWKDAKLMKFQATVFSEEDIEN